MEIGTEISQKVKTAIKTKLVEFGSYVDDELPDYIMVMIANKRSQIQMIEDLNLFLGENSKLFCDWLHDLLLKLQEVTEGAFEVKVPLKRKSTETKPVAKTDENEALKISKLSRNPSPIRIISDTDVNKKEESSQENTSDGKIRNAKQERPEKHHRQEEEHSGTIQSTITMQKRPTLSPSKQANPILLKKAMHAAQVSTDSGEYNPEIPTSTKLPTISDAEAKIRKREQLMEEHKKLQRLKSQQEEETTAEPVLELQVAEDDDLFNTEEPTGVRDSRIVMEKSPERESKLETGKKEKNKKVKKSEKRKIDEGKEKSSSGSDDEEKGKDKERNVKTKEKRKKPKFIVTLEGVATKFEEKYEKEHSKRKRRRKSGQKDEVQPEINRDVPVMPVYPQFIHGVHQVPGMIPAHLNPIIPPPVHVLPPPPPTIITAPHVPVETTIQDVSEDVEFDDVDKGKETCRFWPQCKNGDECPFYHPDITCKHFPNCRYGKDCSYGHPPCKFGTRSVITTHFVLKVSD
ncbi:zinc finger CCCH domain-containing 14-like [Paramuricea clavata]|uniref:Zinc finger CCCH domain-containing protein 14 n=1 Tax=Paramuricea clavata TaxID=317549 RepID=A0A7D9HMD1_PARCT|nr:zinc finger CCCH domain-containing 14-like [Paramuricea clavata]